MSKPIILIGFKHVGKSVIGEALAARLNTNFVDLDRYIESAYGEQIAQHKGLAYFRSLESICLKEIMKRNPGVLSLGGGTPLALENQLLIKQGTVIWIRSTKGRVYERIMISGRPTFFPEDMDPYQAFNLIWSEREPIYQSLADYHVYNIKSVDQAVKELLNTIDEGIFA